jgi:hypothetical protein
MASIETISMQSAGIMLGLTAQTSHADIALASIHLAAVRDRMRNIAPDASA